MQTGGYSDASFLLSLVADLPQAEPGQKAFPILVTCNGQLGVLLGSSEEIAMDSIHQKIILHVESLVTV